MVVSNATRIRKHFADAAASDPGVAMLVEEAARISSRLDKLDAIITGKSRWISLMHFRVRNGDKQRVEVSIDGVLAEARQQATALRAILAQLGVGKAEAGGAQKGSDPIDEIAKRRAARAAGAATRTVRPRRSS